MVRPESGQDRASLPGWPLLLLATQGLRPFLAWARDDFPRKSELHKILAWCPSLHVLLRPGGGES